jgi:predicted metal-dependent peptidase
MKRPEGHALTLPVVELTPEQERRWVETRTKFLYDAPGFAAVMYRMMNPRCRVQKAIFTTMPKGCVAATDGLYVMVNPEEFFKLNLKERVFVVAHEVIHAICNHPAQLYNCARANAVKFGDGTSLPFVNSLWQVAADYVINAMLVESSIGKMPELGNIDPWYREKLAGKTPQGNPDVPHTMSVPDAYRTLWKDMPSNGGPGKHKMDMVPGGGGDGQLGLSGATPMDQLMEPGTAEGKHPAQAQQQRSEYEWKTAVAAAMESARAQGKLPGAMRDMFTEVLEPQVPWQEYIHGFARSKMGGGSYDFRRPDRRLITRNPCIYAPARSGLGAENVVVGVDTSGSVSKKEVNMFFAELMGIFEDVRPQNLWVMWCDAAVHRVDKIEDTADMEGMYHAGPLGGGGTDFRPVFNEVAKMDIKLDALLYLTDGHGRFPSDPGYHVLWGSICLTPEGYPFGEVVMIPKVGS